MSLAAETLQALADARRKAREREVSDDIRSAVLGALKPYDGSDLAIATRALHDVGAEQFGAVHGPVRLATRSSAVAGKAWEAVAHPDPRKAAEQAFTPLPMDEEANTPEALVRPSWRPKERERFGFPRSRRGGRG